jgi:hypothetical protein
MKHALTHDDLFGGRSQASFVKLLRKKRRELRARDPGGMRRLAKLSDSEMTALEADLLEQAITQLRARGDFATNPEAEARAAMYEYDLRLIEERERFRHFKRSIPRYRPRLPEPRPPALAQSPEPPTALPFEVEAPPPHLEQPTPPPKPPDNVIPFRCYGKAFGIGAETHWIGGED